MASTLPLNKYAKKSSHLRKPHWSSSHISFAIAYEQIFIGDDNYLCIGPYETSYENGDKTEEAYTVKMAKLFLGLNMSQSKWTKDKVAYSLR